MALDQQRRDVNVQHDLAYLLATGVLPNYAFGVGIDSSAIRSLTYAPLGAAGIEKYMPGTGDRDDIGPITNVNAQWLISQDRAAAAAALAQANAAASIPWHFYSRAKNGYLSLDDYPTLWGDPRGTPTLTQPVSEPTWAIETSHQPNLSFVPYLLTGERFHLDQINAQGTFALVWTWNAPRQNGKGIVVNEEEQVRGQAWNLRQISDAAWANPDGTATKSYWQRILQNNLDSIKNSTIPTINGATGAVAGFFPGVYRGDSSDRLQLATWQQDMLIGTLATAATRGSSDARTILNWSANWQVERWGHGMAAAVAYVYYTGSNATTYYNNWPQLEGANGISNALPTDGGYWVPLGLYSLAAIYNATGNANALAFYSAVKSKNAPGTDVAAYRGIYAKFNVAPSGTVTELPPPTATSASSSSSSVRDGEHLRQSDGSQSV